MKFDHPPVSSGDSVLEIGKVIERIGGGRGVVPVLAFASLGVLLANVRTDGPLANPSSNCGFGFDGGPPRPSR